jgi:outer membrane protein assembly factor BamB
MEGFTYALKASNGTLVWKKDLGMKYLPGYVSGGIAEKGIYYTGSGAYFQALEVATERPYGRIKNGTGGEGLRKDDHRGGSHHYRKQLAEFICARP